MTKSGSIILQNLTYGLMEPHESNILQQIIQGTKLCCMSFNQKASPIFIARTHASIAGLTTGHKGSGDESHVLVIEGSYLCGQFNDEQHLSELQLAFVHYAEKTMNVTHYKVNEFDTPKPISVMHFMPPQQVDSSDVAADLSGQMEPPEQELNYAYH
jgi:hypothetical protein